MPNSSQNHIFQLYFELFHLLGAQISQPVQIYKLSLPLKNFVLQLILFSKVATYRGSENIPDRLGCDAASLVVSRRFGATLEIVYPARFCHIVDEDNSYFIALYTTEYFDRLMKIMRESSIARIAPVLNFLLSNFCQPYII